MAGATAGPTVEIAADQEEEKQGDRRIEVGMGAADPGLVEAHHAGQNDADRDRNVHVGAAGLQGGDGRTEERSAGIGDGRQGDGCRKPMEEGARRLAHGAVVARPDGDRQEHDIGGGKSRHPERAQQVARVAILAGVGRDDVVGGHLEAEGRDKAGMGIGVLGRTTPAKRETPRREVHASPGDGRVACQQALDQPDAGGAVEAFDQQVQRGFVPAGDVRMAGEVGFQGLRPPCMPFLQASVEGIKTGRADDGVCAGASCATELTVGKSAQDLAAMRAAPLDHRSGRGRAKGDVGHCRNIRRV